MQARVIRMVGQGEMAMREAIESGMLSADTERMARKAIADCRRADEKAMRMEEENRMLLAINGEYRKMELERIRCEVEREEARAARRERHARAKRFLGAAFWVAAGAAMMWILK